MRADERRGDARRSPSWADRGSVMGRANPIAPPLDVWMEGPLAVAEVVYDARYEGAPGFVHGGHVALAFDQLGGVVVAERSVGALTGRLEVRYRKPTRLHRTIRYEAVLDEAAGRLAHVRVRALDGDEETAEAKLAFVELDPTHFEALVAAVPAPRP